MILNYYWIKSPSGIAEIMIATKKTLKEGQKNDGVFRSVNCSNPHNNPFVIRKATKEDVEAYAKKGHIRPWIESEKWSAELHNSRALAVENRDERLGYYLNADGILRGGW